MPGKKAPNIILTCIQQEILQKIINRRNSKHHHVLRAQIIIYGSDGLGNQKIADALNLDRQTVRVWRTRWFSHSEVLFILETELSLKEFHAKVLQILSDHPRSGAPATFSSEQVCRMRAISCEDPQDSGYPISHWTPKILRQEIIKRGIVSDISPRSVGRFLKWGRSETPLDPVLGISQN